MVAIPLVAGKEKVGLLEVLNKAGGEPFQEEDRLLLQSIAEEIAFAIHDAKLFDAKQALTAEIEKMHQFQTKLIQTSHDGSPGGKSPSAPRKSKNPDPGHTS